MIDRNAPIDAERCILDVIEVAVTEVTVNLRAPSLIGFSCF